VPLLTRNDGTDFHGKETVSFGQLGDRVDEDIWRGKAMYPSVTQNENMFKSSLNKRNGISLDCSAYLTNIKLQSRL